MTKKTESSTTSGTETAEAEKVEETDPKSEPEKEVCCLTATQQFGSYTFEKTPDKTSWNLLSYFRLISLSNHWSLPYLL